MCTYSRCPYVNPFNLLLQEACEPTACAPSASFRAGCGLHSFAASRLGACLGFQRCFVATGSRGPAASAVMLAAAVTAGVTSAAVRVPPAEILPAAVEALRRMSAASHVEAA